MKARLITSMLAGVLAVGAGARDGSGLSVYLNPGHGGHESNDRNVVIEPYKQGDPEGYWESNSNLEKALALRDMLEAKGYKVTLSRVTNTSDDDLPLSTIVRLANNAAADVYFSIHSNATGTSSRRNFPLMLYRGYDNDPERPESKVLAGVLNKHLLENQVTYWTSTTPNLRGDFSFYPSWGNAGLGALRGLTYTGMLSEGSFHDYIPETYRLMNKDFCWLEAFHFRKAIDEYLNVEGNELGAVMGRLNDSRLPRDGQFLKFGIDKMATIQGARVELLDEAGNVAGTYTTEVKHPNGVYAFRDVKPGKYTVRVNAEGYYEQTQQIEVVANEVTYPNFSMNRVRSTPPVVESYSPVWKEGDEALLCNTPVSVQFNWDMDEASTAAAFKIDPPVAGQITWEDLNYRMVFTPTEPYQTNTLYTVTIGADAAHPGGMTMGQPFSFSFRTTDRNFMEIIGQFPKQDETVHYHGAAIEMRFDKQPNVTPLLNQITCTDSKGNAVTFNRRSMTYSKRADEYGYFRIPMLNDLTPGETYSLTLSGDFADKDGITIKAPVSVTFSAVDAGAAKSEPVIDGMEDAAQYVYEEEGSSQAKSHAVGADASGKLFGDKALKFTYEFEATSGGELLWCRTEPAATAVRSGDKLGVHLNGDLTDNQVYLQFTSDTDVQYVHVADMDFLGWRYCEVPTTTLEGDKDYRYTGVKVVQKESQMSRKGVFELDAIHHIGGSDGVDDVTFASLTVYPNPASEYLIANADVVISGLELIDMSGKTVARATGNVLNVSEIPAGHYIVAITAASGRCVRKAVVTH